MLEGNGDEKYISSNLIDSGFRKGLPENADGKVRATYFLFLQKLLDIIDFIQNLQQYLAYADAQQLVHKNQEKLLHLFIERQILLHAMATRDE